MKAFFFDMDGVLLDSLPHHIEAWTQTLGHYGIDFNARYCYLHEGMTSREIIRGLCQEQHVNITDHQLENIYEEKTAAYRLLGGGKPMANVDKVLDFLHNQGIQIWVVTGGGQHDLYEQLEGFFPGIFHRDRMITARNTLHGKPAPDPYIAAWKKCGFSKEDCCVIENAPLGIRSGKAAGLQTLGVNSGALTKEDLYEAGADHVFANMQELYDYLISVV